MQEACSANKPEGQLDRLGSECSNEVAIFYIQGPATIRTNKVETPKLPELFEQTDIVMLTGTYSHRHINFHVSNFQYFELNRTGGEPC